MNPYFQNLSKLEFIVTYACTGRCKHCSVGGDRGKGAWMEADVAADMIRKVTARYPIRTVMTFGGEPLLYPEIVCAIHRTARERNVPRRQVITNGYFSKDPARIRRVAQMLAENGVNDLLLSVDAFHQETIPVDVVKQFALELREAGVPLRIQPAWLVSREHPNEYNRKTRALLREFAALGMEEGDGNVIFPEGNALKYLADYFADQAVQNPYWEDPADVRCLSVEPDGTVLGENCYRRDILDILETYAPGEMTKK